MDDKDQHLYHVIKDGKSGFINNKGQVMIDFDFEEAASFSEGLARIFVKDKVGFIDTKGNVVIPPKFDNALGFENGLAVVTINGNLGYINMNGEIIIDPLFYRAESFYDGLALVHRDILSKGCFIDKKGKTVVSGENFSISKYREGLINCSDKGKWGYIDLKNKFIVPPVYELTLEFAEGKAAVLPKKAKSKNSEEGNLYGFINHKNEMIIDPIFKGADIRFSEGLCAVWNNGYGYIDEQGQLVIPYELELGEHFNEGLAVFKPKGKNDKYGFIDKSGNVVIEAIFTSADDFNNGLACVVVGENYQEYKYGVIDKQGNYVWEPTR